MDKKRIAAQMYTVRAFLKTPEDIAKSMKMVKDMGYDAIQYSGFGAIEPVRLKEIAEDLDLKICASHIEFDRIKNDMENVVKEHELWNCRYIGIAQMPVEYRSSKEGFLTFAKEFSVLGKMYEKRGFQLIYHNHKLEFEKFDGVTGMDILIQESDPEVCDFEIDTYWVQAGGADPVEWIRKVKGRMDVVHFKDMAIKEDKQIFAEIGEGNLNWPAIIEACRETGVKWHIIEQDSCQRDPFESLAMSLKRVLSYP